MKRKGLEGEHPTLGNLIALASVEDRMTVGEMGSTLSPERKVESHFSARLVSSQKKYLESCTTHFYSKGIVLKDQSPFIQMFLKAQHLSGCHTGDKVSNARTGVTSHMQPIALCFHSIQTLPKLGGKG